MHPTLCNVIERSDSFGVDERAAARKVRNKYAEYGGLPRHVSAYGLLTDEPAMAPTKAGAIWRVPLRWVAARPLRETQLIGEDLHDVEVLAGAADDYLNSKQYGALRVRVGKVAGGGGNTSRVLANAAVHEQLPSLCVVDSDRECPGSPLGPTAQDCMAVTGPGLYEVVVTAGRELENAVPWRLIDQLRREQEPPPSEQLASLNRVQPRASQFVDLKRGCRGHDITRLAGSPCETFWQSVQEGLTGVPTCCPTGCRAEVFGSCGHRLVRELGRSMLGEVESHLRATAGQHARHRAYVPSPGDADWLDLGKRVFEAGLGLSQRRI